ncbi:hypothetical protein [Phaeovulum vinaykumarii]|uniref:Uncharacterized protein n=1 Tax=Phaeovulum vinaykumarii TaxID=407234 RepID=A0A1N7MGV7_9RHOB|nr:hypothetical protein [Phaeovulum vinaykumarii]SIS85376.1 hypothetical protein SAMN05421795_107116 [Phaeovulum vinaykumarii]SOC12222.1 hypothetical protein SAMN05878426_107116 [Phaeovulum vinaykumarii]
MGSASTRHNCFVTARAGVFFLALAAGWGAPTWAQAQATAGGASGLDPLFDELADPDGQTWARAESDIRRAWSHSGSAAMDLLLQRAEAALDAAEPEVAVGHLTAVLDHAPDFAAAWAARANAQAALGRFGPAAADAAQALSRAPRDWSMLTLLGSMLEDMNRPETALAAFRASDRLHPHQQDVKDAIRRLESRDSAEAL